MPSSVVVRVSSHVIPVRKGCHRQRRRHPQARSLVFDTEYLLHRLLALLLDIRIYSILALGFSAACILSRPPPTWSVGVGCVPACPARLTQCISPNNLSLTPDRVWHLAAGSSCSSISTSIIALVALEINSLPPHHPGAKVRSTISG